MHDNCDRGNSGSFSQQQEKAGRLLLSKIAVKVGLLKGARKLVKIGTDTMTLNCPLRQASTIVLSVPSALIAPEARMLVSRTTFMERGESASCAAPFSLH